MPKLTGERDSGGEGRVLPLKVCWTKRCLCCVAYDTGGKAGSDRGTFLYASATGFS